MYYLLDRYNHIISTFSKIQIITFVIGVAKIHLKLQIYNQGLLPLFISQGIKAFKLQSLKDKCLNGFSFVLAST